MTQEDKQLLLKDLSGRLPYGVLFQDMRWPKTPPSTMGILDYWRMECKIYGDEPYRPIEEFKMYLRPMSSMTAEEKYIYRHMLGATLNSEGESIMFVYVEDFSMVMDWLNERHFDYRGLIEKGLAIEVTEENNPYK